MAGLANALYLKQVKNYQLQTSIKNKLTSTPTNYLEKKKLFYDVIFTTLSGEYNISKLGY